MDIKKLLMYGKNELSELEDGYIKAKILLEYVLKMKRKDIISNYNKDVTEKELDNFKNGIDKIKKGTPVQYITNNQEFMKMNFYVDENVLIPQPDTEILVEETIKICNNYDKEINVLDLCTGSGAIAVSISKYVKNAKVYASDISKKAIEIAQRNAVNNNVNVEFIYSDMFDLIPKNYFDIIISNPPYIETDVINSLSEEVKHEPRLALDGGENGLNFYEIIAKEYKDYLKDDGHLLLEIGYDQAEKVNKLFNNKGKVLKDLSGNDRVIILKKDD